MARSLKPMPIGGTDIHIIAGPWKGRTAKVDRYHQGRLYANEQSGKTWTTIGPINPEHIEEINS